MWNMFKVNHKNTRTTSGVFIVDFEQVNVSWVYASINYLQFNLPWISILKKYYFSSFTFLMFYLNYFHSYWSLITIQLWWSINFFETAFTLFILFTLNYILIVYISLVNKTIYKYISLVNETLYKWPYFYIKT